MIKGQRLKAHTFDWLQAYYKWKSQAFSLTFNHFSGYRTLIAQPSHQLILGAIEKFLFQRPTKQRIKPKAIYYNNL